MPIHGFTPNQDTMYDGSHNNANKKYKSNGKPHYTKDVLPIRKSYSDLESFPATQYVAKVQNYNGKVAIKLKNWNASEGDIIAIGYHLTNAYNVIAAQRMSHYLIGVYETVSTAQIDGGGVDWAVTNTDFPTCAANFTLNNNTVIFSLYTKSELTTGNTVVLTPKKKLNRFSVNSTKHDRHRGTKTIDLATGEDTRCSSLLLDSWNGATDTALEGYMSYSSNGFNVVEKNNVSHSIRLIPEPV